MGVLPVEASGYPTSKMILTFPQSGGIEANNCQGNLELHTSGGSLRLDDLKGNINASTSGGSVRGSSVSGQLKAVTSGGSINLNKLACSLETSPAAAV